MVGFLLRSVLSAVREIPPVTRQLRGRGAHGATKASFVAAVILGIAIAAPCVDAARRGAFFKTSGAFTLSSSGRGNRGE